MNTAQRYRALLEEATDWQKRAFERGNEVSGADLVDWFADWRKRAVQACREADRQPAEQQQALDL